MANDSSGKTRGSSSANLRFEALVRPASFSIT
jgi:hypothetical protein